MWWCGVFSRANIIDIVSPEKGGRMPWQLEDKKYGCSLAESLKRSSVFNSVRDELKGTKESDYLLCKRASEIQHKKPWWRINCYTVQGLGSSSISFLI